MKALHSTNFLAASREAANERFYDFVKNSVLDYACMRNYDLGPNCRGNVSQLSPYFRLRLISEQEVVECLRGHYEYEQVEKFVQEVCWRSYWKGWLEHRPHVWTAYNRQLEELERQSLKDIQHALSGGTGIKAFDFWVKELMSTGYLHNHARMWFASIWIHTLKLPWAAGAQFFYHNLLDADAACNTLSWRWVAGLHTEGKTYLASKSNISKFTKARLSAEGLAESPVVPDEGGDTRDPYPIETYPAFPEHADETFLAFLDDLSFEVLLAKSLKPKCIGVLDPGWQRKFMTPLVSQFYHEATDDFKSRCEKLAIKVVKIGNMRQFQDWLMTSDIKSVHWYRPFVGESLELAEELKKQVKTITIVELRRPWDSYLFPRATKGFFQLKKSLPNLYKDKAAANVWT